MTSLWILLSVAAASPTPLVALGDALLAPDSPAPERAPGWVSVLADCLSERSPGSFEVLDRTTRGMTAASAREAVPAARALGPELVVVGLGAQELSRAEGAGGAFRQAVGELLGVLREEPAAPVVMLVGLVPPSVAQLPAVAPSTRAVLDERAVAWNGVLFDLAAEEEAVHHVDLLADWPVAVEGRHRLTRGGLHLSDRGHARVAAQVCDAVLALRPSP